MTLGQLLHMEAQICGISRERLLEMESEINRWEWPTELGEAPEGWETMSAAERDEHIRDWHEFIGGKFSEKEKLRYHHIHNLHSTEQQFEDWWNSEVMKALHELQSQTEQQRRWRFTDGLCIGICIMAIVINLTLLLMRLC